MDKIFLVDDDPIFSIAASVMLTSYGVAKEVVHFKNGKEALSKILELSAHPEEFPGVILLDINMPLMDGWELLEQLKTQWNDAYPGVKIFMLSSSIDPQDLERFRTFPFLREFLTKPLTEAHLQLLKQETAA